MEIDPIVLAMSIVAALVVGYLFRKGLIDSMSNVKVAQEAHEYLKKDSVNITTEIDTYLYTTITAVPKSDKSHKNSDDDDNATTPDNSTDNFNDDSDSGDSGDSGGSDD